MTGLGGEMQRLKAGLYQTHLHLLLTDQAIEANQSSNLG